MTLISCPVCEKEISAAAIACPHCGHPLDKLESQKKPQHREKSGLGTSILVVLFVALVYTLFQSFSDSSRTEPTPGEKEALVKEIQKRKAATATMIDHFARNRERILRKLKSDYNQGNYAEVVEDAKPYLSTGDKDVKKLYEAAIVAQLRTIPASQLERNAYLYGILVSLRPNNQKYKRKYEFYKQKIEEKKNPALATRNRQKTTLLLTNLDYEWRKAGFGSVLEADFTIHNQSKYDIKDIEITCAHFAKSGTKIDSNTRTIYDVVKANDREHFNGFNMGLIHSQVNTSGCKITDLKIK